MSKLKQDVEVLLNKKLLPEDVTEELKALIENNDVKNIIDSTDLSQDEKVKLLSGKKAIVGPGGIAGAIAIGIMIGMML